jgi:hypothetical protein
VAFGEEVMLMSGMTAELPIRFLLSAADPSICE